MSFKEKARQIGPDVAIALILSSGIGYLGDLSFNEGFPSPGDRTGTVSLENAQEQQQAAQDTRSEAVAEETTTDARLRELAGNACINYLHAEYPPERTQPDEEGLQILTDSGVCGNSLSAIRKYVDELYDATSAVDETEVQVETEASHVELHEDGIKRDKAFPGVLSFPALLPLAVVIVEKYKWGTPLIEWSKKTKTWINSQKH